MIRVVGHAILALIGLSYFDGLDQLILVSLFSTSSDPGTQ
jgi:hypothetical protein